MKFAKAGVLYLARIDIRTKAWYRAKVRCRAWVLYRTRILFQRGYGTVRRHSKGTDSTLSADTLALFWRWASRASNQTSLSSPKR